MINDKETEFLTPRDLAQRWKTSEKTLERWRMVGSGPVYLKMGGRVLYSVEQVMAHESARIRSDTSSGMATAGKSPNGKGHPVDRAVYG